MYFTDICIPIPQGYARSTSMFGQLCPNMAKYGHFDEKVSKNGYFTKIEMKTTSENVTFKHISEYDQGIVGLTLGLQNERSLVNCLWTPEPLHAPTE